jgi:hypothetical protein
MHLRIAANGEKEITERVVIEKGFLDGSDEIYHTGNPSDILSRIDFLDMLFRVLYYMEDKVGDALKPTTPTAQARKLVEWIGDIEGSQTQDDGMLHQRERKERQ